MLFLVDEDTRAQLRDGSLRSAERYPEQKEIRRQAIQEATLKAIEVPFKVMKAAGAVELLEKMAEIGNPNSSSDAAVGALCLRTAVSGACLNVRINAVEIKDPDLVKETLEQAGRIEKEVIKRCEQIQKKVLLKISAR